jgi:hypothetical protein
MLPRITLFALAFAASVAPASAQQGKQVPFASTASEEIMPREAAPIDPRLVMKPRPSAPEPGPASLASAAAARPRWVLPAIGAGIGLVAGVVQAHATTQGDYVGLPVEPMYLYPPAYAAAGALLGWLADAALRE